MAESIPPLRVRDSSGTPNLIPVFDMVVSGGTLSDLGGGVLQLRVDSGGGGGTYVLGTPILVGSGGTGQLTLPTFGFLYGSGASPIQSIEALSAGALVVGSGVTTRMHVLGSGATGQQLISTGGVVGNLAWVNTLGGAAAIVYAATGNSYLVSIAAADLTAEQVMLSGTGLYALSNSTTFYLNNTAKYIRIPLGLLTVQPDTANAFWSATTWPLLDEAFVAFVDGGEGIATYWTIVPLNLHPDPNWNLSIYHQPNAGAGGNAIVTFRAAAYSHAESAAYTLVASAGSYATQALTALAISAVSGANFDSVLALSGGDLLYVEVNRHGGNANDTVGQQWNLKGMALNCNVL